MGCHISKLIIVFLNNFKACVSLLYNLDIGYDASIFPLHELDEHAEIGIAI